MRQTLQSAIKPLLLVSVFLVFGFGAASAQQKRPPKLDIPIKCTLGQDCFIQHFVDMQGGSKAADHRCGFLTYNNHRGTDIRIRTLKDMEAGVPVIAAADGVVGNFRDDIKDHYFSNYPPEKRKEIYKIGLGNAVVLNHGNKWSTFYAHLKEGSVTVKKGQRVRKGDILGFVGLSGVTDFPHLHFDVRHRNRTVDPFTGLEHDKGCGKATFSMWSEMAQRELKYTPTYFVNTGFSETKPKGRQDLESGEKKEKVLNPAAPTMFFWSYYIGSQKEDQVSLRITGPDGRKLKAYNPPRMTKNQISNTFWVGVKRPPAGWRSGTYRGEITVTREGQVFKNESLIVVQ
ncbi:peptidoglycan DD-metalloendopeptidase family protein [Sneathiella sp. P13V-1]|uniref:M23 family metallopeptidase n=1 Tax=Sneathiella sp. P13V-1 TaxID=2697366 RepID=UPI00187B2624|nr:M23 family metallopeptidase [Sneathiella sp. P13V-1]MBE7636126.1 peptidoglycan DD-metalloendopeptidase family protein [Sneathiella sp. P13V-1]